MRELIFYSKNGMEYELDDFFDGLKELLIYCIKGYFQCEGRIYCSPDYKGIQNGKEKVIFPLNFQNHRDKISAAYIKNLDIDVFFKKAIEDSIFFRDDLEERTHKPNIMFEEESYFSLYDYGNKRVLLDIEVNFKRYFTEAVNFKKLNSIVNRKLIKIVKETFSADEVKFKGITQEDFECKEEWRETSIIFQFLLKY
jgi:hypothetical protein